MDAVSFILQERLVAISRGVYGAPLVQAVEEIYAGGFRLLEITFDQSSKSALQNTAKSITLIKEKFRAKMCVGAGTVMTVDQAKAAADAGADFALAPNTDPKVIHAMKDLGLTAVPGALTPSEIAMAYNEGADIVKLFPASTLGLDYVKAIRAPISHVPLMAVGGVSVDNVKSFLDNGFCSAGIGSNIINARKVQDGDFAKIRAAAEAFINAIK
ncbi:MAG: bifunctional 4-hydroxy-2-oxoglutarate aldolase/2-dehydro-3-deoxy-phosphogluconate aldolase [Candidatus Anaerobiospirillum merdipullorum]|uniref:Bifunctional 4-hydroxy-2-oxoglutarate aldolase/2-dehydro-3-deoxy-phosphogluconate aldolase n=1 Tax=Candidatus Anaerobiospirillum merdipullorum TaxID=2838450 RepID=A0A9E2NS94_9GAMM|nr:bifunctional 4-hydroxy-2-oxoglutarate aldolase/2-dehydro-3-deoxy-phosphogluconate aldolase [Candidatus Anaerobiospirillum merdipullorum]